MAPPLVEQLRFTRSEWLRGLRGVTAADALHRLGPNRHRPQGLLPYPEIQKRFVSGGPASTPALRESLAAWRAVTKLSDAYLDRLSTADLRRDLPLDGKRSGQSLGSAIRRMTYHYWFHIGEIQAIRQMLGQRRLPLYVGNIEGLAPYRPETPASERASVTKRGRS